MAIMRESVGSIKAYFNFVAFIAAASDIMLIVQYKNNVLLDINCILGLIYAAAYFYMAYNLRPLMTDAPQKLIRILLACQIFPILQFLLSLVRHEAALGVFVELLICWYLVVNIKRLSKEEKGA